MQIFQGTLELTRKREVARDTLVFGFEVKGLKDLQGNPISDAFTFKPGQFISMQFGEKSWRSYSIASLPHEALELVVRLVEGGVASEIFRTSKIGDTFPFKGPFGHFVLSSDNKHEQVFCATGTGIAPFRGMIREEAAKPSPRPMTLLYGGRDDQDLAYLDEILTWAPDLTVKLGLSRQEIPSPFEYKKQRITEFLEETPPSATQQFYICGNGDMVMDVQKILLEKDVKKNQIFMERFN